MILAFASPGLANDASLGRQGEAVRPIENTQVRMVAEEVRVKLLPPVGSEPDQPFWPARSAVDVTFTFHNTGGPTRVLMGFPADARRYEERAEFEDDWTLHDFAAYVDGRTLAARQERGLKPEWDTGDLDFPAWWTFTVDFGAGQTHTVRNTFWVKNLNWSNGHVRTGYVLTTGAVWAGRIERATVTLDLGEVPPHRIERATPDGYRFAADNVLVWDFRDFEPAEDVEVIVSGRHQDDFGRLGLEGLDYPRFEKLIEMERTGRFAEALAEVRRWIGEPGLAAGHRQALAARKAHYLLALGHHEEAMGIWEEGMRAAPEPKESWEYTMANDTAVVASLARAYSMDGRVDEVRDIYLRTLANELWPLPFKRWLRGLLPPDAVPTVPPSLPSLPAVVFNGWFPGRILDPDGDLDMIEVRLWTDGDKTHDLMRESRRVPPGTTDAYVVGYEISSGDSRPPQLVRYRVVARDAAGHVADSGERYFLWLDDARTSRQWNATATYPFVVASHGPRGGKAASYATRRVGILVPVLDRWLGGQQRETIFVMIFEGPAEVPVLGQPPFDDRYVLLAAGDDPVVTARSALDAWLRRVLVQAQGPGWETAPEWFVSDLAAWLVPEVDEKNGSGVESARSVARFLPLLAAQGGDAELKRFLAAVGQAGFAPALRKTYGISPADLGGGTSGGPERVVWVMLALSTGLALSLGSVVFWRRMAGSRNASGER